MMISKSEPIYFLTGSAPACVSNMGTEVKIYGTFHSLEAADLFMGELAKLLSAVEEGG